MDRLKAIKNIRNKLKNGQISIGSWMQIPNTSVAEIMGESGYDWVTIDMEHGAFSASQLPDLFRALELGNTLPLVRLLNDSPSACKQALDSGAGGVIVPMVKSLDQLNKIKQSCSWPPNGTRGVGFSRANLFGKHFEEYRSEAQNPILIAMIENIEAVKNLDEILSLNGLDAILIGPYDLSASMHLTAEFENQEFKKVISLILNKCNQSDIACGIHVVNPCKIELQNYISKGYRFIAFSIDSVILLKNATLNNF